MIYWKTKNCFDKEKWNEKVVEATLEIMEMKKGVGGKIYRHEDIK